MAVTVFINSQDDIRVTVYTKPSCVQCTATTKALDERSIVYSLIDLTKDAVAMSFIQSLGYRQVPVVVVGSDHWVGFRPDKIDELSVAF